jgi:hypothetical protein
MCTWRIRQKLGDSRFIVIVRGLAYRMEDKEAQRC